MLKKIAMFLVIILVLLVQNNFSANAPSEISIDKVLLMNEISDADVPEEAFLSASTAAEAVETETEAIEAEGTETEKYVFGKIAYAHLKYIANDIGPRLAGTEREYTARNYMKNAFENLGYCAYEQEFTFLAGGIEKYSANIIADKPGDSSKTVIIGAHYDSVDIADGADDNASGIAVILEAAELLKNIPTPYTIRFVAFGAEEYGWWGSKQYTSLMSEEDTNNTVVMINLDSLIAGDYMYVYGTEGEDGWVREKTLDIAERLGVNMATSPGYNEKYPVGTTGDWSDHVPFKQNGIPYAYLEATNWEIGELDGYTQTVNDGKIYHTWKDSLWYLEENYPGRVEERLEGFVCVITELLKTFESN